MRQNASTVCIWTIAGLKAQFQRSGKTGTVWLKHELVNFNLGAVTVHLQLFLAGPKWQHQPSFPVLCDRRNKNNPDEVVESELLRSGRWRSRQVGVEIASLRWTKFWIDRIVWLALVRFNKMSHRIMNWYSWTSRQCSCSISSLLDVEEDERESSRRCGKGYVSF